MDINNINIDSNILNHGNYKFLIKKFGKETIEQRFESIYKFICEFIESKDIIDDVIISVDLVNNVVLDYFTDIYRLKDFQDIELVNYAKIYAYTAYWLLRRKPIQIKPENSDDKLSFINEEMVVTYLFSYLFGSDVYIVQSKLETFTEFQKNLLYSFIYRNYSPQFIETMIYSIEAGKAYQYSIDYKSSIE